MKQPPLWVSVSVLAVVACVLALLLVFTHSPTTNETSNTTQESSLLSLEVFTKGEAYGRYVVTDVRPYNPDEPLSDTNYTIEFGDLQKKDEGNSYLQVTGVYQPAAFVPVLHEERPYVSYKGRTVNYLPLSQEVVTGLVIENPQIIDTSIIRGAAPVVFTVDRYTYHRYKDETVAVAHLRTAPMDLDRFINPGEQILTTVKREDGRIYIPAWKFSFKVPEGYTYEARGEDKGERPLGWVSIREMAPIEREPITIGLMIDSATHGPHGDYKQESLPLATPIPRTATLHISLDPKYPGTSLTWGDIIRGVHYAIYINDYRPEHKSVLEAFLGSFAWE